MKMTTQGALVLGLVLFAVSLGLIGVAGGIEGSCITCHSTQASRWAASSHADIACHLCHQRQGALGLAEQRVRMLSMARSTLLPRQAYGSFVPDDNCVACHGEVLSDVLESNGTRVRHIDIIEQGRRCTDCHNRVAHADALTVERVPLMDDCMACHRVDVASGECAVCHVPGAQRIRSEVPTPWQITHGVTWRYTHGLGNMQTCQTCHPNGYCVRCHGVDLPHPASWANTHGRSARSFPDTCEPCHASDLCSGCHSTEMPHGEDFLPEHSAQVRESGKQSCLGCHMEASCDACHVAHVHPGLKPDEIARLREAASR